MTMTSGKIIFFGGHASRGGKSGKGAYRDADAERECKKRDEELKLSNRLRGSLGQRSRWGGEGGKFLNIGGGR